MLSKVCSACGVEKSLDEFRKRTDRCDRRNTCLDCELKEKRENYQKNRERYLKRAAEWSQNNSERVALNHKKWAALNPDKKRDAVKRWKIRNPGNVRAAKSIRRARLSGCEGGYTAAQWQKLKELCDFRCLCCRLQEPAVTLVFDHVIPLSSGGDNTIFNAQPLCQPCNNKKFTKATDYRNAEIKATIKLLQSIESLGSEGTSQACNASASSTASTAV